MAYNIKNSVGTVVATIADNAVDTSTSITLIGKNYVGYGEKQNQNFYYMLENFAKSTSPSNPVVGQLWYDTGNSVLKIYNGSVFNDLASSISNGNSNVRIAANSNVTVSVTGNANVLTVTGTGANVAGTLRSTGNANVGNLGTTGLVTATGNVSGGNLTTAGALSVTGNANTGNLGTATAIITTGNITTINSGLMQNGTSNIRLAASGNVTTSVGGTSNVFTVSTTGANITGTANVSGNANVGNLGTAGLITATGNVSGGNLTTAGALSVTGNANTGNLGTATAIITTGNITTINSGLMQNGTSNITVASGSNVSIFVNGNATARAVFTSTGANITGTANITGNANVGNLGTAGIVTATGNITTSGYFLGDGSQLTNLTAGASINNGNSNVRVAANANVTIAVTGADRVTFATTSMTVTGNILPSANATYNLGSTSFRWANIWGVSSSALYADLAEKYWSDNIYEAGTVVKLGGTKEITICEEECSNQVFGCISLAPAYLMNNNNFENYQPVVLIGRSVIKVIGKASKGDRLVSAGNGCARKANIEELSYQTEIGRLLVDKNYEEVDLVEAFISTK